MRFRRERETSCAPLIKMLIFAASYIWRSDNYESVSEMKPLYIRYSDETITGLTENGGLASSNFSNGRGEFLPSAGYPVYICVAV